MNLVNCCLYEGFPVNWEWWATTLVGATVMAVLGEVLCMRYEVSDIPLRLPGITRQGDRTAVDRTGNRNDRDDL